MVNEYVDNLGLIFLPMGLLMSSLQEGKENILICM